MENTTKNKYSPNGAFVLVITLLVFEVIDLIRMLGSFYGFYGFSFVSFTDYVYIAFLCVLAAAFFMNNIKWQKISVFVLFGLQAYNFILVLTRLGYGFGDPLTGTLSLISNIAFFLCWLMIFLHYLKSCDPNFGKIKGLFPLALLYLVCGVLVPVTFYKDYYSMAVVIANMFIFACFYFEFSRQALAGNIGYKRALKVAIVIAVIVVIICVICAAVDGAFDAPGSGYMFDDIDVNNDNVMSGSEYEDALDRLLTEYGY